jgi:predicted DsbA family dithiol-disulfide isomerase
MDPIPHERAYMKNTTTDRAPLTVEIWSDVLCPFCYIGKREFENALSRFPHRDDVLVEWKSFELDPNAPVRSDEDTYTMLARKYGMSRDDAKARVAGVRERARSLGLTYDFDKAVIANSFNAHRLIQLAKTKGLGDAAEERLFKAYFTDGEHIGDSATLVRLGAEIGLDRDEVSAMLASDAFTEAVRIDEYEAQQFGIRGVPFFAIDRKYGISGAQSADHILGALEQAWKERPVMAPADGAVCEPAKADRPPGH